MKFSLLKSKIKTFYTIFIVSCKEWLLPKKAEVLIYDACGAEALMPYLNKHIVTTMAVRGEVINVPCLLRAALTLNFWKVWKYNPFTAYTEAFIQAVSPKVVITFIDNNQAFYVISNRFPDIKTIFIQNGIRTKDVFEKLNKLENYHVDYMCVFGDAIGKKYNSYITGKALTLGSLKNNAVKKNNIVSDDIVLFISQYREKAKKNAPFFTEVNGTPIYHDQFYSTEVIALKFLVKWCAKNKKILKIAGVTYENNGIEREFYASILDGCAWEYQPKTEQYSSYKEIDAAEIVVFIDSTMGYESIVRGKRTASFSCRMVDMHDQTRVFGWPAVLPNNGPFWTNDQNETQFQRVMDYLNTVSDDDWEQTRKCYASELIEFDSGNTRFVALLQVLLGTECDGHTVTV